MNCNCSDWQENIDSFDMALFNYLVNIRRHGGVKRLIFCPWCGQRLTRLKQEEETLENDQLGYAMGLGYDAVDSEH